MQIVGAWHVDANGAPYVPHQFVFTSDGVVFTTNPTNVQDAGDNPTTDSVGMGVWRRAKRDRDQVIGTFYQLNARQPGKTPAERLRVTFRVRLNRESDRFAGPAWAELEGLGGGPAQLIGRRLEINESDLERF